jgi:transcriptional regulator with XRE-family HTH domain
MTGTETVRRPGSARRALVRHLMKLREDSGLTYEQLTDLGLPRRSSWNRWKNRQSVPNTATVAWICERLGTSTELRERMVELAGASSRPTWYEQQGRALPTTPGFTTLLELEEIASRIDVFGPLLIPGLFQSPRYQSAVIDVAPGLTTSTAKRLADIRAQRQERVIGQGAHFRVILDEAVLTRQVGGAETMREQIGYLVDLDGRSDLSIFVLPFAEGAHPGGRGEFTLLWFPEQEKEPPFSYAEGYRGAECSEDPEVIEDFTERFDIIMEMSIPIKEHLK